MLQQSRVYAYLAEVGGPDCSLVGIKTCSGEEGESVNGSKRAAEAHGYKYAC